MPCLILKLTPTSIYGVNTMVVLNALSKVNPFIPRLKKPNISLLCRLVLCLVGLLSSPVHLSGQNLSWAKDFSGGTLSFCCVTDAQGNVYTTGYFNGLVDFDPGPAAFNLIANTQGWGDIFVCKLNAAGNFVWARSMGGTGNDSGHSLTLDAAGNVYITGTFESTADFDPDTTAYMLNSFGLTDIFISKLDSGGNFVWAKQLGGAMEDHGFVIALDVLQNIVLAGVIYGTGDFDPGPGVYNIPHVGTWDFYITKLDTAGNFFWAINAGGGGFEYLKSMALDPQGNILVTGFIAGGVSDFDPGSGTCLLQAVGAYDVFVAKYRPSGSFAWAKRLGGNLWDVGLNVTSDLQGNVYSSGYFCVSADFDPGPGSYSLNAVAVEDGYVSKLDSSGNFIYAKNFGGAGPQNINCVKADLLGNLYALGSFRGTIDMDPGPGILNYNSASPYFEDFFLSKLDQNGDFISGFKIGDVGQEIAYSMDVDLYRNLYLTGRFDATVDFDPGPSTTSLSTSGTGAFVLKFCQIPENFSISGKKYVCSGASSGSYSVFNTPGAIYTWTLPPLWQGLSFSSVINTIPGNSGGMISVSAQNSCGYTSSQSLSISIVQNPSIIATCDRDTLCLGETVILNAYGAASYTWSYSLPGAFIFVSPYVSTQYHVVGVDTNACSDTTSIWLQVETCAHTTEEHQTKRNEIILIPNPTNSNIILSITPGSSLKLQGIKIINSLGQVVQEEVLRIMSEPVVLQTSGFDPGMYQVHLMCADGIFIKTFVKY